MMQFLLFILLLQIISSQQPIKSEVDLSGTWQDKKANNEWTISQNGVNIEIVNPRGVKLQGIFDGKRIKYIDQTVLIDATGPICRPFIGQAFEFPAVLKLSKGGTKLERKTPDTITKGTCTIRIGQSHPVVLTHGK